MTADRPVVAFGAWIAHGIDNNVTDAMGVSMHGLAPVELWEVWLVGVGGRSRRRVVGDVSADF